MKPQRITLEQVKEKSRQAYDAGTLIAQSGGSEYGYLVNDCRCAIGTTLNADTLAFIDSFDLHQSRLYALLDNGIVHCSDEDKHDLETIQDAHDNWFGFTIGRSQITHHETLRAKKRFLDSIDYQPETEKVTP